MSQQAEARSWWADVEHLRDVIEDRRAASPEESMQARYERVHRQERERRTVQITGRPVSSMRLVEVERRRPPRSAIERLGPRPDRIALWAVLLGVFCCVVALTTAHP